MESLWKTDKWFVSPWNYENEVVSGFNFPQKIQIHDTTLRDGEQQAGLVFNKDEKIRIAKKLAEVGVDRIEAGMPAVSEQDELAIKEIVKMKLGPKIFAFSRCVLSDVRKALVCGVDGIIIEIPSSKHIIEQAYGWPVEKAIELSIKATKFAKENGLYIVFFPVDMTRAEMDWFLNLIKLVSTEGHMDAMTIVDTMGVLSPSAVGHLVNEIKKKIDKPLEAHFHNDFGLAAANTVLAMAAGVGVAHTSISGIGERAGMTAYEDIVMILRTMYGIELSIKFEKLYETSKLLQEILGITLPGNTGIVGDQIFDVESGIVTAWMDNCLKSNPLELFPFHWDFVGHRGPRVVLGKHSGGASIRRWLRDIGMDATDEQVNDILAKVKSRAYEKKTLLDEGDFKQIALSVIK